MAIRIQPTETSAYTVNGKEVYQDMEGSWVAREELTTAELRAWSNYKKIAVDGNRPRLIMTFKG